MAVSLTITVTDQQATRARTAYGKSVNGVWTLATAAEMQAAILAWIKEKTLDYETTQDAIANRNTKSAEVWGA